MTAQPLISVITVVYNGEKYLEQTIQSVLNQTYKNLEYLIIDGGSTDATLKIMQKYQDRLAYWVSEPDQGIYDAMNKGIQRARGEWIHLLNSDDYYHDPQVLARVAAKLHPEKTNYFSMVLAFADGRNKNYKFNFKFWKLYVSAFLPHPALIVAASQYQKIGLYDIQLKIAADHDLILRLLQFYPANYADINLVVMRQSGFSANNLKLGCQEFRAVTIRHGLPRWLAWGIYQLKLFLWRNQLK